MTACIQMTNVMSYTQSNMYIYTPLCRYWIALYRHVLVFIVPHVDIELEDNKQFISNIPRMLKLCKFTILWRWHKMNHSWFTKHRCNHLFNDIYFICRHSGSVVERPLCDREDAGSIPGRVIPKNLKMVLAALLLGAQHWECRARIGQLSVSIMWLGGISCQSVWGVIFQWGNTLQVNSELPAISRHRRDMTERLLKATLSPNQTNIY